MHDTQTGPYWAYQLFSDRYDHPDAGSYRAYGILCYRKQGQSSVLVAVLQDISTQHGFVRQMVETFTRCQLSPVHLSDAVADALAAAYTVTA